MTSELAPGVQALHVVRSVLSTSPQTWTRTGGLLHPASLSPNVVPAQPTVAVWLRASVPTSLSPRLRCWNGRDSALGTAAVAGLQDAEAVKDYVAGGEHNAADGALLSGAQRPEGRF